MDAPAPTPSGLVQEISRTVYIFNILAILIDVMPLLVLSYARNLTTVRRYFSLWSFIIGARMNFGLVCHIVFALDPMEHMDALFVAVVGMCLGTVCSFLWLLHMVIVDEINSARHWMFSFILALVTGSGAVLYGFGSQFRAGDGCAALIWCLTIAAARVLNGIPFVAMLSGEAPPPDIPSDGYTMAMAFLTTLDTWFFVVYAHFLRTLGSLFMYLSYINAICSLIQFFLYLEKVVRL